MSQRAAVLALVGLSAAFLALIVWVAFATLSDLSRAIGQILEIVTRS